MSDILMVENGDGGDIEFSGGDIVSDDTFFTAVYLSLFTGEAFYNVFSDYPTTKDFENALNSVVTDDDLKNLETLANEALAWFVSEGIAKSVSTSVTTTTNDNKAKEICISITITQPDGDTTTYSFVWDSTSKKLLSTDGE